MHIERTCVTGWRHIGQMLEANYPETLGELVCVGAPYGSEWVLARVRSLTNERTFAKIHLHSGTEAADNCSRRPAVASGAPLAPAAVEARPASPGEPLSAVGRRPELTRLRVLSFGGGSAWGESGAEAGGLWRVSRTGGVGSSVWSSLLSRR